MIGIIPAAGRGTRLGMGCKPLVQYKGKYLIVSALENFIKVGIKEAIIIQGPEREIEKALGNSYCELNLKYLIQAKPKGIAHAINLTQGLIPVNEPVFVILGDIIYDGAELVEMKNLFEKMDYDCLAAVQRVEDKSLIKKSYGVFGNTTFIEKPKDEDLPLIENLLGLGIYMFSYKLFDAIERTQPSKLRNEIEITDALNNFEFRSWCTLNGLYKNINTPEDLQ